MQHLQNRKKTYCLQRNIQIDSQFLNSDKRRNNIFKELKTKLPIDDKGKRNIPIDKHKFVKSLWKAVWQYLINLNISKLYDTTILLINIYSK